MHCLDIACDCCISAVVAKSHLPPDGRRLEVDHGTHPVALDPARNEGVKQGANKGLVWVSG